ncbi:hypothetical protein BK708_25235 [Bacillus thuringiensis serovar yunnanensis]|nr:hypothetical protein BK708_25235 [Bacillus thuringiensis serovar yunnanensis]
MFNIKERLGQIKLKTKLSMAFIAILIIPSLIVGVSSYNKAKTDLNETILQSAKDNISILDKIVDDELENKHTDITHFAKVCFVQAAIPEKCRKNSRGLQLLF